MCRLVSFLWVGLCGAFVLACADANTDEHSLLFEPTFAPMSGYVDVRLDLQKADIHADAVTRVRFGTVDAIQCSSYSLHGLTCTIQGHPEPGLVDVRVETDERVTVLNAQFEFLPTTFPQIRSLGAFGASLTQGIQRGVPTFASVTHGPAALLAKQLGVYFPLPLLIEDAFSEMEPTHMGPPPYCNPPELSDFQQTQAVGLIQLMTDANGRFDYRNGRLSPDLMTHNMAVGGTRVAELLSGPPRGDLAKQFLSHLVFEPEGTLGSSVRQTQLSLLDQLDPDIIVSFDSLGNDLIEGMINEAPFDLSGQTAMDSFATDVAALVERLARFRGHCFVATLPRPNLLPYFELKRARLINEGIQLDAERFLAELEIAAVTINEQLKFHADAYDNVHVVDVASIADQWHEFGVLVGEETLNIQPYGGLVGLDGLHFTDVGYALLANAFIEHINAVLGVAVPEIDLSLVRGQDRERPQVLHEAGLDITDCMRDL